MTKKNIHTLLLKGQITKRNLINFEASVFAFSLFMLTPPFYVWHSISPLFFVLICSSIAFFNQKSISVGNIVFFMAFFFIYLYIPIRNQQNIFGIVVFMLILTLFILSSDFINNTLNKYIFIYSITLIPSLIVFVIVYILRIDLPHSFIKPLNPLKLVDYVQYPFLVEQNSFSNNVVPQFFAYYDESGVVGTVSALLLMISGFDLKKKINIPIFISGILSFSFAFYLIVLVYGFTFFRLRNKIILTVVIIGFVTLFKGNSLIDSYVFNRFDIQNGKLAGDDRIADSNFNVWYKHFSNSSDFYFGLGEEEGLQHNVGGSSYKNLIVNYGIVFFVLINVLLVMYSYSKLHLKKEFYVYLFILLLVIYQRPNITNYFYLFLVLAPITFMERNRLH
jgi:hypothetical protein